MDTLNTYGPWTMTILSLLGAAAAVLRQRKAPTATPATSGLLTAAGGFPGLLKLLAELPQHIEDIKRILAAVSAILEALSRALPKPPEPVSPK